MKKYGILVLLTFSFFISKAQYRVNAGASLGADVSMATLGVEREFNVISKKFHINPGVRINVFNGKNLDYITAPAEYTSNDDQVDTLGFSSIQNNFVNLYVRLGYDITEKLSLSFDIDLFGASFGSGQSYNSLRLGEASNGDLTDYSQLSKNADPTIVNVLLVGDNDLGSLNSTLSLTYNPTQRIGIDLGAGLVFTEYTTDQEIGTTKNTRFRNKSMMGYLGVSYLLGDK